MLMTKRKPATVGEILIEEFMQPLSLTQAALAEAMGVQRKHVNELCNNRRNGPHPCAGVREQSRILVERAEAQRPVAGDAQSPGTRTYQARQAAAHRGLKGDFYPVFSTTPIYGKPRKRWAQSSP